MKVFGLMLAVNVLFACASFITMQVVIVASDIIDYGLAWFADSGRSLSPPMQPYEWDGSYDHLDAADRSDMERDDFVQIEDGEYEEGEVEVPRAVI